MKTHADLSDEALEVLFSAKNLDPKLFSHEAHLRLAWIYISKYGLEKAETLLSNQIKAYATSLGDNEKFNLTLTVAAAKIVDHFMRKSNADTFQQLLIEFPRLKNQFKKLLETHYTSETYQSLAAKKTFLPPDKSPFI